MSLTSLGDIFSRGDLAIPEVGTSDEEANHWANNLHFLAEEFRSEKTHMIGFPGNLDFDYHILTDFLSVGLNNCGSPYTPSPYAIESKQFEQEVITFFAKLTDIAPDDVFGYTTSGGTEGNIYGIYLARENLPANAVLYSSAEAHYSIGKIARLLALEHVQVATDPEGRMSPTALRSACEERSDQPAIVLGTIGTPISGAIDDVALLKKEAIAAGVTHVYLHVDAALGGLIAPFLPQPPEWAFTAGADSLSISGHKLIGSPVPCGVVLARKHLVTDINNYVDYAGVDDATLSGSRSGLGPLLLWFTLHRLGRSGLAQRTRSCLQVATYAEQRLGELGMNPHRSPDAITVLFDVPPEPVCRRWHLANIDGVHTHLIAMPHVTTEHIDRLCAELAG